MVDVCTANTQTFSYSAGAGEAVDFSLSFTDYSHCYKQVWDEIATILEAQSVIIENFKQNVDQIKTDIKVLRTRAEDPTKGVVMAPWSWYNGCYNSGNNAYQLENALAILALKQSNLYQKFIEELENPTTLPGD